MPADLKISAFKSFSGEEFFDTGEEFKDALRLNKDFLNKFLSFKFTQAIFIFYPPKQTIIITKKINCTKYIYFVSAIFCMTQNMHCIYADL